MKRFLAAVAFVMLPVCAPAAAVDGDTLFLAARDAYAKGDRAALASLAAQLDGHPLAPWARYFQLSLQLRDMQKPSDAGVAEFVEAETGSWLGEKLRSEWLKWLVDRQDWPRALEQFSLLARPDQDAVCRGLMARLQLGDGDAAQEAGRLLAASQPLAASCLPPLGQLAGSGALPSALLWERLFRQWSLGRLAEARVIASWLPAAPAPRELDEAAEHPMKTLLRLGERLPRQKSAAHEIDRGAALAALAVLSIARADARVAAARWLEIEKRAPDELAGIVWTRLAYQAALAELRRSDRVVCARGEIRRPLRCRRTGLAHSRRPARAGLAAGVARDARASRSARAAPGMALLARAGAGGERPGRCGAGALP